MVQMASTEGMVGVPPVLEFIMAKMGTRRPKKKFWETAERGYYKGGRHLPIMIACSPFHLEIKLKSTRQIYRLPWPNALSRAIDIEVAAARAARHAKTRGRTS